LLAAAANQLGAADSTEQRKVFYSAAGTAESTGRKGTAGTGGQSEALVLWRIYPG